MHRTAVQTVPYFAKGEEHGGGGTPRLGCEPPQWTVGGGGGIPSQGWWSFFWKFFQKVFWKFFKKNPKIFKKNISKKKHFLKK